MKSNNVTINAVDLFCGVGGLTFGLEQAGVKVRLGVDIDPACAFPIENNSGAKFLQADVAKLGASALVQAMGEDGITLLAGCAPCQPFSTYSRTAKQKHGVSAGTKRNDDWMLVHHFGRVIKETQPDLVAMENVAPLAQQDIFQEFLGSLDGYWVDWAVVECSKIGLPQSRKRLVLLASRLGPIKVPVTAGTYSTVKSVIGGLPLLAAGAQDPSDRLHKASRLSPLNLTRIKHSVPGGTWRDWPEEIRASCHVKSTGATYSSVYGRMEWDTPAPTITTQCFGFGNGRFGHPEQDRAISLREAAMLQGFPRNYKFIPEDEDVSFAKVGRLIGNAVPVTLGKVIGDALIDHASQFKRVGDDDRCE